MPHKVIGVGPALEPIPLLPTEQVIFSVHPSLVPLVAFLAVVLGVGGGLAYLFFRLDPGTTFGRPELTMILVLITAVVGFLVALIIFLNWLNTIYSLTNLRVQLEFGILGERTKSIDNSDIQAVQVDQGILGRIFNYGDVSVRSAQQAITIDFATIGSPTQRGEQIQEEIT